MTYAIVASLCPQQNAACNAAARGLHGPTSFRWKSNLARVCDDKMLGNVAMPYSPLRTGENIVTHSDDAMYNAAPLRVLLRTHLQKPSKCALQKSASRPDLSKNAPGHCAVHASRMFS